MANSYIGEIRMFAGTFAPQGWAFCLGQPLPIAEYDALFTLIGTTYGGDGEESFNLPNLASRIPLHTGTGPDGTTYQIGEMAGTEQETLTVQQIPFHSHPFTASTDASQDTSPAGKVVGQSGSALIYIQDTTDSLMYGQAITPAGGSQPHENTQPFLCINFIISLYGIWPSQS
jgi:microcystin-dependent protein